MAKTNPSPETIRLFGEELKKWGFLVESRKEKGNKMTQQGLTPLKPPKNKGNYGSVAYQFEKNGYVVKVITSFVSEYLELNARDCGKVVVAKVEKREGKKYETVVHKEYLFRSRHFLRRLKETGIAFRTIVAELGMCPVCNKDFELVPGDEHCRSLPVIQCPSASRADHRGVEMPDLAEIVQKQGQFAALRLRLRQRGWRDKKFGFKKPRISSWERNTEI